MVDKTEITNDDTRPSTAVQPAETPRSFAEPQPHDEPRSPRIKALGGVLLILVSLASGFIGGWVGSGRSMDGGAASTSQARVLSSESDLISNIAQKVGPSVVSIDVTSEREVGADFFGNGGGTQRAQSAGTGILLTGNGLIVTNRHVVPLGTTQVSITLADGTQLDKVTVVGRTRESDPLDIAFLKIEDAKGKKLTPAKIGDSSKVEVGDRVVAIGNALGQFQNTVTSGIISGYGRDLQAGGGGQAVENLQDLFQTDAAINQGNSGGPLVNANNEVIGINTAVAGGSAQGIGFAIPVNNISGMIKNVIATGEFKQPYLGVRYVTLTNDIAQELDLKVKRGAYILPTEQTGESSVVPDSPADKAGLKGGDIIIQVNGTKVDESHGLTSLLARHQVGDDVDLRVLRDGREQNIKVKLGEAPRE